MLCRSDLGRAYPAAFNGPFTPAFALFTLTLLQKGAYEANHLMAWLLEIGDGIFVSTKVAITAAGILFLLMHSHFHIFSIASGKRLLQMMVGIYGLLIVYELILLRLLS